MAKRWTWKKMIGGGGDQIIKRSKKRNGKLVGMSLERKKSRV